MTVSAANARSERWSPNGSERSVDLCSLAGVTRALCTGSAMRSSSTDCPIAAGHSSAFGRGVPEKAHR